MGQRLCVLLNIFLTLLILGCDKPAQTPATTQAVDARAVRVVSLTPAGTNLLVAMGMKDQIVGVSAYEADIQLRDKLPKVGDYQRIDWEQLSAIKPTHLIVQGLRDRLPAGIEERCAAMNIQVVILQIDRLKDIYAAITQLGAALHADDAAKKTVTDLQARLTPRTNPAASNASFTALVLIGDEGKLVVGTDNYINDVLELSGAKNAVAAPGYLMLDVEKGRSLAPDVVFILAPRTNPQTDPKLDNAANRRNNVDAKSILIASDKWPAIKTDRVYAMTDADALLPGANVANVYDFFVRHLKQIPPQDNPPPGSGP
ncbi:MAG: ABC transporter substrate-binding protein [Burkholderiales bacterium]|nr:ABC transporter substrate-binding protein [Phycisphaerae bacterium]